MAGPARRLRLRPRSPRPSNLALRPLFTSSHARPARARERPVRTIAQVTHMASVNLRTPIYANDPMSNMQRSRTIEVVQRPPHHQPYRRPPDRRTHPADADRAHRTGPGSVRHALDDLESSTARSEAIRASGFGQVGGKVGDRPTSSRPRKGRAQHNPTAGPRRRPQAKGPGPGECPRTKGDHRHRAPSTKTPQSRQP